MSTERFFLDTAYILARINARDQYHHAARALAPRVRAACEVWVTEAVLTEVGNGLARSYRLAAARFIQSCYRTPNIHVVSVDPSLFQRAVEFYQQRSDKTWGLTDCISFIVMQEHGLTEALTTDEHFQQAGFRALLRKEASS